jgi:hypothetical protein
VHFAHLTFVGAVQACGAQGFEQFVGAFGAHAVLSSHRDAT